MGCDIHLYVERKTEKQNEDGEDIWEHIPSARYYESREHQAEVNAGYEKRGEKPPYDLSKANDLPCFDPGRNYDLFGMLANVRNGRGFAGCDTGDGFEPVLGRKEPTRGIPRNASDFVKARVYDWDSDGHSHSHLTVAELLAYDLDRTTKSRGVVDAREYIQFKEHGHPDSWAGGIGGSGVLILSNEEMDKYVAAGCPKDGSQRFTQVEWSTSYRDEARRFFNKILPALAQLGPHENVRIVFFFDN